MTRQSAIAIAVPRCAPIFISKDPRITYSQEQASSREREREREDLAIQTTGEINSSSKGRGKGHAVRATGRKEGDAPLFPGPFICLPEKQKFASATTTGEASVVTAAVSVPTIIDLFALSRRRGWSLAGNNAQRGDIP